MEVSQSELESISKEDQILKEVINSLKNQQEHYYQRSDTESKRARELTASIVATRRDEEKAMLASDEAVSHALEARNQEEIKRLKKLIKKPYFARIVLEEENANGSTKTIEYKIGYAANPDCRIIDWRKAPISKLYYEYKQGDEYSEEIQGRERNGRVSLKNTVEIENSELKGLSGSLGSFKKVNGSWRKVSQAAHARSDGSARDRMRDVLALINIEQFRTITEDADSAVLIQGIAGSGKTTVALHRLAWLLEPGNSDLKQEQSLVLVQTASLRTYVINTLNDLGFENITVLKLQDWLAALLARIAPRFVMAENRIRYSDDDCPASIERLKKSMALLNCLEIHDWKNSESTDFPSVLLGIMSRPELIMEHDETKLINKDLIQSAAVRTERNFSKDSLDYCDLALIVRMHQLRSQALSQSLEYKRKHIVIDEVQDASALDLAVTVNAVENLSGLTIVGDASQNIQRGSTFPGWDRLRRFWDHKEELSTYMELKVSHRSTLPIMKLADHIQGRQLVTNGREGRVPIWFKCRKESDGIEASLKWLTTALERYPHALTAVLCSDEKQARFAFNMLEPTFRSAVRLASHDSFSFEAGIIVSDIKQVKGLEFLNVLLWNPSEQNYPADDTVARNALYVAATRAEENLCIATWNKPSRLLPRFPSPLIRWKIIEQEEEAA